MSFTARHKKVAVAMTFACCVVGSTLGFYSPDFGRWTTRDPEGEEADANLYLFCRNSPVQNIDPNGLDIYLYTGNNSGNPVNDALHQTVAVDTWSDDCPPKKTGIRGFPLATARNGAGTGLMGHGLDTIVSPFRATGWSA